MEQKLKEKLKMETQDEWTKIETEKNEIARQKAAHSVRINNFEKTKREIEHKTIELDKKEQNWLNRYTIGNNTMCSLLGGGTIKAENLGITKGSGTILAPKNPEPAQTVKYEYQGKLLLPLDRELVNKTLNDLSLEAALNRLTFTKN